MEENIGSVTLLTYRELSVMTRLPLGTLYSMVSRGEIPHLRIGPRLVRFRIEDVEQWIAAKLVPSHERHQGHDQAKSFQDRSGRAGDAKV